MYILCTVWYNDLILKYDNEEAVMADNINITLNDNNEHEDSIKIADDVIRCIAALAATDIDGVSGMAGSSTDEIVAMLGRKTLDKGVKMSVNDDVVKLTVSVIIKYGCNIPDVSAKIQDKVRSTIESMTGLTVSEINVNVAGIDTSAENI